MKPFLDERFLLETKTAERLYHEYAKNQPIIDYHCHLPLIKWLTITSLGRSPRFG